MTIGRAQDELSGIAAELARQYPDADKGWSVRTLAFYDWLIPASVRDPLAVLLAAITLVLLIACANVANLLLARAAARQKELSISHRAWRGTLAHRAAAVDRIAAARVDGRCGRRGRRRSDDTTARRLRPGHGSASRRDVIRSRRPAVLRSWSPSRRHSSSAWRRQSWRHGSLLPRRTSQLAARRRSIQWWRSAASRPRDPTC
jgi:hypothetical protein